MSVFANVAALAKGLYLKQKFTTFGVYLWKKLCFLTSLQKKNYILNCDFKISRCNCTVRIA